VPFIDMALLSGKILGISATDTATLGGRNRRIERRYLANVKSTAPLVHEIGVRVLLGYVARMAARYDRGIEPIISIWRGHFYRIYVRVLRGAGKAKRSLEKVSTSQYGGPMWMGELHDFDFLKSANIPEWLPTKELMKKYLEIWRHERGFLFYHLPSISRELHVSTPSPLKIIDELQSMGYEASRTQFSPQGVRSSAPLQVIEDLAKGEAHK
jgi:tRNA (guanine26-N2/guanine27-N2)-dimethyltransferase